jgi:hypothetical protein
VPFCHPHHAVTMASCLLPGYFGLLTRSCHVIQVDLRDRDAQELDTERFLSKNNGNLPWHNILRAFAQNARSDVKQAKTRNPYAKLYTTLIILTQLISLSERRRIRRRLPPPSVTNQDWLTLKTFDYGPYFSPIKILHFDSYSRFYFLLRGSI